MPSTTPAVACAEYIALLHLLNPVPVLPCANETIEPLTCDSDKYTLPFEMERSLASTIAFLSAIRYDPNHIPAVCVQEVPMEKTLNIILAVNECKYMDGESVRQDTRARLEKIFAPLSHISCGRHQQQQASSRSPITCGPEANVVEEQVFSAIVCACSERILERLRFKLTKPTSKQPVKQILQLVTQALTQACPEFLRDSRGLIFAIDSWHRRKTMDQLKNVVECASKLSTIEGLRTMLESIPNRRVGPSEKQNLLNILTKVARYRQAAKFLCHLARKSDISRRMRITLVSLSRSTFAKPGPIESSTLSATLARLTFEGLALRNISHVWSDLKIKEDEANRLFTKQRDKSISEGKLHAEMQLIYYLETTSPEPPPRVISSSKDACFLCNTFITCHGKYHCPRYHGRLYPGWRLPTTPLLESPAQRFVQELEKQIVGTISAARIKRHPDPLESTIFTLPLSESILKSSSERSMESQKQRSICYGCPNVITPSKTECFDRVSRSSTSSYKGENPSPQAETLNLETGSGLRRGERELIKLLKGDTSQWALTVNDNSPIYEAWPIRLQVEYSTGTSFENQQEKQERTLVFSLEWLRTEEAEVVRRDHGTEIIDVERFVDTDLCLKQVPTYVESVTRALRAWLG